MKDVSLEEGRMEIIITIIVFSVVQSVLGVGLLVFGTPTLLLLGNSFETTLSIVLPASIVISSLQVRDGKDIKTVSTKNFNYFALPFLIIGLVLILKAQIKIDLKYIVGTLLIVSGLIKAIPTLSNKLSVIIKKYEKIYLALMGFIHGLSNMGGGLLTVYSSSVNSDKKLETRHTVAYGYLLMGVVQLVTLYILKPNLIHYNALLYIVIAFVSYKLLGSRVFNLTSQKVFNNLITGIILFYGITILIK
jgi:uncharacterized membrane protein YfcA